MPWCSSWEGLASGGLSCHLLNEIRAPAPGLDPFEGLDIPTIREVPQPDCPLLDLPAELLYAITDHIHSLSDILSFGLTCNQLLSVSLKKLRVSLHDHMKGAWIDTPLICLGSLTSVRADLPPHIQPIEESFEIPSNPISSAHRLTYRPGARRLTYYRFEITHTLLKNYDKLESPEDRYTKIGRTLPISGTWRRGEPKSELDSLFSTTSELPSWVRLFIKRAIDLEKGLLRLYSPTGNYVIRNLSKKEYIPFSAGKTLKSEIESVFFRSQLIPVDQAVTIIFLFLISWSASMEGLEDETVRKNVTCVHGVWAGDRFDVCEIQEVDEEWKSVEDETVLSLRLYLPRMYKNMHWPSNRDRLELSSFWY
ncbi:hypothetical protein TWF718_003393 [Orbilia javanica]